MNRKLKYFLFVFLVLGQIVVHRYYYSLKLNLDLLYLVLAYVAVRSGFYRAIFTATVIGLITDYLSGSILGVFGFSRTIAAYLLNEISIRIDLKNNLFVFLFVSLSLAFSNLIASLFLYVIRGFAIEPGLVLYQPFLTGLVALLIVSSSRVKEYLDVY
jgi:rod shape-determining protein MreD